MNMLVDERQTKQADAEKALDAERQRAADLARQVDDLKDLIAKLEADLDSANRAAASRRARGRGGAEPSLAALNDPGRLTPAVAFAAKRDRCRCR